MDKRAKLYGSGRWRRHPKHQLQREPWCRLCRARGETTVATVADHIHPHHGDVNQFWCGELQSLCRPCHDGRKRFAENRGFDSAVGADSIRGTRSTRGTYRRSRARRPSTRSPA